jgi:hypothetical protein
MTSRRLILAAIALLFACAALPRGLAEERKAALECTGKALRFQFGRYPVSAQGVHVESDRVHFLLTPAQKNPGQVGLYSYFSITGDFEISASYEWTPVFVPKEGYGVSIGIAIDADAGTIVVARGNIQPTGSAYVVTHGTEVNGKREYRNDPVIPTKAKSGRLVLRRESREIVCLTADGAGELEERCRIPFSNGTVRKVRIFADPGNASTSLDASLSKIAIKAEAISGQIPLSEPTGLSGGFIALAIVSVGVIVIFSVLRIQRSRSIARRRDEGLTNHDQ